MPGMRFVFEQPLVGIRGYIMTQETVTVTVNVKVLHTKQILSNDVPLPLHAG